MKTIKTYPRETNEGLNKMRDAAYPWIKRRDPQIKILGVFSLRIDNMILKFIWNAKNLNSQNNIEKKKRSGKTYTPSIQDLLSCYSDQDDM